MLLGLISRISKSADLRLSLWHSLMHQFWIRIWHSESKCQNIGLLIKACFKQLKASLALEVRNLNFSIAFLLPTLTKFSLFRLLDFEVFRLSQFFDRFDLPTPSPPSLPTNSLLSAPEANIIDDLVIFNIKVSCAAILLKLWIKCQ